MLQLQLRNLLLNQPKKNIFFAKLLLVSLVGHCIFFMVVLLMNSVFSYDLICLSKISDGSTVIVLPLIKTVQQPMQQVSKEKCIPQQKKLPEKKIVPQSPIKKNVQKKSIQHSKIQNIKQNVPHKLSQDSQQKKSVKSKPEPVKKEKKSQEIPKKTMAKKIEQKPEPIKENNVQTTSKTHSVLQEVGRDDLDLIALCNEIKEGIAKTWKRPTNISSSSACHVKVCIHSETNRDVTITHSSQALALDIMVKNFVMTYPFPKAIWHKEIELIF